MARVRPVIISVWTVLFIVPLSCLQLERAVTELYGIIYFYNVDGK